MSIKELKSLMPEYAKDVELNLSSTLSKEGSPGLTKEQILGTALASAYTLKDKQLVSLIKNEANEILSSKYTDGLKIATSLMAMNNIYYRFIHFVKNDDYKTMPTKLRMNKMMSSGIPKVDFEIYSLAVSSINGCGLCVESHEKQLIKHGVSKEGIQSAIKISAVMNSAAQVLAIESGN